MEELASASNQTPEAWVGEAIECAIFYAMCGNHDPESSFCYLPRGHAGHHSPERFHGESPESEENPLKWA